MKKCFQTHFLALFASFAVAQFASGQFNEKALSPPPPRDGLVQRITDRDDSLLLDAPRVLRPPDAEVLHLASPAVAAPNEGTVRFEPVDAPLRFHWPQRSIA